MRTRDRAAWTATSPSATTDRAAVRRLRRASRPLRLWRHLRARAPDRRRAAAFAATCWRWCASWRRPSCAIPAATSSPATIGRTASARSSSGRGGSISPGCRPRRTRSAPTSSSTGASAAGIEPMLAVNLGTRGADAARNLVEYCNHPGGTALSDLRRSHGWEAPHDVRFWCLGNEMDGPWQMERKTPTEYGRDRRRGGEDDALDRSDDRARRLRLVRRARCRPSASGRTSCSSTRFDHVEYISLHTYLNNYADDTAGLPRQPRPHGQLHRGGGGDRRRRRRPAALARSGSC